MRRIPLIAAALILLAAPAAAQVSELDTGPGAVTPDSAFYGLEVAWDNAMMGVGLAAPGMVVQERVAEARAMQQRNNTAAMQRAVQEMSQIAERARSGDTQGLQKALAVLQQIRARAPQGAQEGIRTAIGSLEQAQQRIGAGPGGTRPNGTDGDFNDTPGNDSGPQ